MKHHYLSDTTSSEHYAISKCSDSKTILIQLGNDLGEQVRLNLTLDQAQQFSRLLQENMGWINQEE